MKHPESQSSDHGLETKIARHVRDIPRSGIRDFFEVVQSMGDVISLGIGEPDFVTPWHIREAAIYSLEKGRTGYTSNLGQPRLRESISRHVESRYGVAYDPATEILVAVGVSEALDIALRALLDEGDEVIYHEPCYVSYNPSIRLAKGVPVAVETTVSNGFTITAEALRKAITPRTKAVMLNFPTNPTGATLRGDELRAVAGLCAEHDLVVLTDEIYAELTYDGSRHESIAALAGMRERTVFFNGVSKAFAMTGFRIGYACAPPALTEAMMRIHQYSILCAPITSQEAAVEALDNGIPDVERMRGEYQMRRNYIVGALDEMGLPCRKPPGSFYVFPDIRPSGLSSADFAMRLLKERRVAVVPGTAFGRGGEGFVRCSYATGMAQLKLAMEEMRKFIQSL